MDRKSRKEPASIEKMTKKMCPTIMPQASLSRRESISPAELLVLQLKRKDIRGILQIEPLRGQPTGSFSSLRSRMSLYIDRRVKSMAKTSKSTTVTIASCTCMSISPSASSTSVRIHRSWSDRQKAQSSLEIVPTARSLSSASNSGWEIATTSRSCFIVKLK